MPDKNAVDSGLLSVEASPHLRRPDDTRTVMFSVNLALLPAAAVGLFIFGLPALRVLLLAVVGCLAFEALFIRLFGNEGSLSDGSALVTGLLLAFNLPPASPWWLVLIGALVAMLLGKHIFGGLGHNPFNPALVARVFLLIAWPVEMTTWSASRFAPDGTTQATPLGILKTDGLAKLHTLMADDKMNLALGNMGGSFGEISAVALILGALFLFFRGYLTWHIPVSFLATVAIFTGIFHHINPTQYADPLFHLLSGGVLLGALFMATDMVTSPMTGKGMLLFGLGCGLLTAVIRLFGSYPEGVSFAILIMNALTPIIDRYVRPTLFGTVKKK
ncbi:MAG: electron transporter RnfD [Elusimicrobia bacterium RIFOXYB2_FULL_49_7]|nr:MAG: electron transporter RnfD [Elusimicrobia bacterium RIFOXYB2_FULL_49_7]